nr:Ig-like domain-containing protein [Deinococcus aestuarii]
MAACNGTRTPSAVATVEVTAPSDLNVKLNDTATTTRFTAIARGSDGTALTSKTVVWKSSNENVATIDVNGVVTAKHFGETTISATVDGVAGNRTTTLRTYGLEAFAGIRDGGSDTAMFFRYRTKTGKDPVNQTLSFTVTGPTDWNGGQPVSFQPYKSTYFPYEDGSGRHWFQLGWTKTGAIAAVTGDYTVKFNVDGEEWAANAKITSLSNSSQAPTSIKVTAYNSTSVTSTWDDVVPNGSYRAEVFSYPPTVRVSKGEDVNKDVGISTATIQTSTLSTGQNYYIGVHAMSLDVAAPVTTALSGQFDVRYSTELFNP